MKNKKIYVLTLACIVLAGAAWYITGPYQDAELAQLSPQVPTFLAGTEMNDLDKMEVTTPDGRLTAITKTNNVWTIAESNWPTDTELVQALVQKIGVISREPWEEVSVNPERKSEFGVSDDQAKKLVIYARGQEIATLLVGNTNSTYSGTYVSRPDDERTYLVPDTFVRALDTESWPDKKMLNLQAVTINTVTLAYRNQAIVLEKNADEEGKSHWRSTKPYAATLNSDTVDEWLRNIGVFIAADIPDQATPVDTVLTLTLAGADGGVHETITVGGKAAGSEHHVARNENSGRVYFIAQDQYAKLAKQLKDFQ